MWCRRVSSGSIYFGMPACNRTGAVLLSSLAVMVASPGAWAATASVSFMLAATILGYLIGIALPTGVSVSLSSLCPMRLHRSV